MAHFDGSTLQPVLEHLRAQGAVCEVLAPEDRELRTAGGTGTLAADRALTTMASVLYDAVLIAGGDDSAHALGEIGDAVHYATEAYKHATPVGAIVPASTRCAGRSRPPATEAPPHPAW